MTFKCAKHIVRYTKTQDRWTLKIIMMKRSTKTQPTQEKKFGMSFMGIEKGKMKKKNMMKDRLQHLLLLKKPYITIYTLVMLILGLSASAEHITRHKPWEEDLAYN